MIMPDQPPTVSVIVPCFNLGAYLPEAVDSVLAQSFQDFEVLIADDGSTDPDTIALLDTFDRPKTTVIRAPHQGLAATRNLLLQRARGTFLCALDADDRLHPEFLARTLAAFQRDPGLTFVSTKLQMFGEREGEWPAVCRCDLPVLLAEDTVITAALTKREAVLGIGGYDERMPAQGDEDWDLWISLVEAGHRGCILDEVLFYYRRRRGSMCDDCTSEATHLALMRYIVAKHAASYRRHWLDVMSWQARRAGTVRRAIVALEREMATTIERAIADTNAEVARLSDTGRTATRTDGTADPLARASNELAALREEYNRAIVEVRDLRQSVSWRLTGPLRVVYDRLVRRVR